MILKPLKNYLFLLLPFCLFFATVLLDSQYGHSRSTLIVFLYALPFLFLPVFSVSILRRFFFSKKAFFSLLLLLLYVVSFWLLSQYSFRSMATSLFLYVYLSAPLLILPGDSFLAFTSKSIILTRNIAFLSFFLFVLILVVSRILVNSYLLPICSISTFVPSHLACNALIHSTLSFFTSSRNSYLPVPLFFSLASFWNIFSCSGFYFANSCTSYLIFIFHCLTVLLSSIYFVTSSSRIGFILYILLALYFFVSIFRLSFRGLCFRVLSLSFSFLVFIVPFLPWNFYFPSVTREASSPSLVFVSSFLLEYQKLFPSALVLHSPVTYPSVQGHPNISLFYSSSIQERLSLSKDSANLKPKHLSENLFHDLFPFVPLLPLYIFLFACTSLFFVFSLFSSGSFSILAFWSCTFLFYFATNSATSLPSMAFLATSISFFSKFFSTFLDDSSLS